MHLTKTISVCWILENKLLRLTHANCILVHIVKTFPLKLIIKTVNIWLFLENFLVFKMIHISSISESSRITWYCKAVSFNTIQPFQWEHPFRWNSLNGVFVFTSANRYLCFASLERSLSNHMSKTAYFGAHFKTCPPCLNSQKQSITVQFTKTIFTSDDENLFLSSSLERLVCIQFLKTESGINETLRFGSIFKNG